MMKLSKFFILALLASCQLHNANAMESETVAEDSSVRIFFKIKSYKPLQEPSPLADRITNFTVVADHENQEPLFTLKYALLREMPEFDFFYLVSIYPEYKDVSDSRKNLYEKALDFLILTLQKQHTVLYALATDDLKEFPKSMQDFMSERGVGSLEWRLEEVEKLRCMKSKPRVLQHSK